MSEISRRVAAVHAAYEDLHQRLLQVETRQEVVLAARGKKVVVDWSPTKPKGVVPVPAKKAAKAPRQASDYHDYLRNEPARKNRITNVLLCDDDTDDAGASVQFLADSEYSIEGGNLSIDVIRVGVSKGPCSVSYHTEDRAAKAGEKYQSVSGTLHFKDGQGGAKILVPLIQDDKYVPVSSFLCLLHDPVDCDLDPSKDTCRITIMDDDAFPSNRVRTFVQNKDVAMIPVFTMLKSFWEYIYAMGAVGNMVKLCLLGDHLGSINGLFMNYLNAYLVNQVFAHGNNDGDLITGGRLSTLYLLAFLTVAPYGVLFLWDRYKASLGVAHRIQASLQSAIVRTYFNLDSDVRLEMRPNHVIDVLDTCCPAVVAKTYGASCTLNTLAFKMCLSMVFVADKSPQVLWMVGLIWASFGLLLWHEAPKPPTRSQIDNVKAKKTAAEKFRETVESCADHYNCIRDYDTVPHETDKFGELVKQSVKDDLKAAQGAVWKSYMPTVLTAFLATVYMISAGMEVLDGSVAVGTYVVTLKTIKDMGALVNQGHGALLVLLKSCKPLFTLTEFLSLDVEIPKRMEALGYAKKEHWRIKAEVKQQKENAPAGSVFKSIPSSDLMAIEFNDVSIAYGTNKVLTVVSLQMRQGTLTAITGPHSSGKRTLVKVLAAIRMPDSGSLFVPAHLRCVHLDKFPELVEGLNLTENLLYGAEDCPMERVDALLELLIDPVESNLLTILNAERDNAPIDSWDSMLTFTDLYMIHLARGLLSNSEFMVMERIMDMLNDKKATAVVKVLRQHVDERGIFMAGPRNNRRPRTVIFSTLNKMKLFTSDVKGKHVPTEVDSVWEMDMDGQVTCHDLTTF